MSDTLTTVESTCFTCPDCKPNTEEPKQEMSVSQITDLPCVCPKCNETDAGKKATLNRRQITNKTPISRSVQREVSYEAPRMRITREIAKAERAKREGDGIPGMGGPRGEIHKMEGFWERFKTGVIDVVLDLSQAVVASDTGNSIVKKFLGEDNYTEEDRQKFLAFSHAIGGTLNVIQGDTKEEIQDWTVIAMMSLTGTVYEEDDIGELLKSIIDESEVSFKPEFVNLEQAFQALNEIKNSGHEKSPRIMKELLEVFIAYSNGAVLEGIEENVYDEEEGCSVHRVFDHLQDTYYKLIDLTITSKTSTETAIKVAKEVDSSLEYTLREFMEAKAPDFLAIFEYYYWFPDEEQVEDDGSDEDWDSE